MSKVWFAHAIYHSSLSFRVCVGIVCVCAIVHLSWKGLYKSVLKTVKTNLWISDKPVETVLVCLKVKVLFVKKKSMQLRFKMFLKHFFE